MSDTALNVKVFQLQGPETVPLGLKVSVGKSLLPKWIVSPSGVVCF